MKKHYIGMAGLSGCMPNCCDVYESRTQAAESLGQIHGLSTYQIRNLRHDGYLSLDIEEYGNEYCEITECQCSDPEAHQD
jgi:hypothetical protein